MLMSSSPTVARDADISLSHAFPSGVAKLTLQSQSTRLSSPWGHWPMAATMAFMVEASYGYISPHNLPSLPPQLQIKSDDVWAMEAERL